MGDFLSDNVLDIARKRTSMSVFGDKTFVEISSRANANNLESSESSSMHPPPLQLSVRSGNGEYDEFLDGIDEKENLQSKVFSGNQTLEKVFDNQKTLKVGSSGTHIAKIKTVLDKLGFLPENQNSNEFDSVMQSGLKRFQEYYDTILEDGVIGPETMRYLDSKAEYLERDFGECEPEEREEQIEDVEEIFEDEKDKEDEKWFWEDKSGVPDMALGILQLYKKHLNGESVNDLYIPSWLSNLRFSLLLYIKQEGLLEEVPKDLKGNKMKNRFYHPIEEIEESLFDKLDQASNSSDLFDKVQETVLDVNRAIATIDQYTNGLLGHWCTTSHKLKDYLVSRSENKNDIYSAFKDTGIMPW